MVVTELFHERVHHMLSMTTSASHNEMSRGDSYLEAQTLHSGFLAENLGGAAAAEAGTGRGGHGVEATHRHCPDTPPVHHQRALWGPAQHHR